MTLRIPTVYRVLFTWVNPLIALQGAYVYYFDRDLAILSFIPNSTRNLQHDPLFHWLGGNMVCFVFLSTFLLRCTSEVHVWELYQAGPWITDISTLGGIFGGLVAQARLGPAAWRWEEWATIGILVGAAVARSFFVAGVGLPRAGAGQPACKAI